MSVPRPNLQKQQQPPAADIDQNCGIDETTIPEVQLEFDYGYVMFSPVLNIFVTPSTCHLHFKLLYQAVLLTSIKLLFVFIQK